MHYIKEIFENKITERVHKKFIRYSIGEFDGPMVSVSVSPIMRARGSFHLLKEFLNFIMENLEGDEKVKINGIGLSVDNYSGSFEEEEIKLSNIKQVKGICHHFFDCEVNLKEFLKNYNDKLNLLINFEVGKFKVKTKKVFPKPNNEFKDDFISLHFSSEIKDKFFSDFFYELKDYKAIRKINTTHRIDITDIKLPKKIENFQKARLLAKRVGVLKRKMIVKKKEEQTFESEIKIEI